MDRLREWEDQRRQEDFLDFHQVDSLEVRHQALQAVEDPQEEDLLDSHHRQGFLEDHRKGSSRRQASNLHLEAVVSHRQDFKDGDLRDGWMIGSMPEYMEAFGPMIRASELYFNQTESRT